MTTALEFGFTMTLTESDEFVKLRQENIVLKIQIFIVPCLIQDSLSFVKNVCLVHGASIVPVWKFTAGWN